ncbi:MULTISPECIES: energy transducer TonB [unclassified Nitratiruptor]|uniref:energy transducer TonB n=1 Tax=unclassified Nitratiruptor TaxID=2624044 RepID=UPI001915522E|nr:MULTISPECIES: energy transducer TonB [unclassified Nitratiruptor]BCD60729.1 periplasmic protein TonB [Nitratiruptor sp. YY08-10]BCD64661.1 periplasmic protein TonB [Nitratiruptor sp. YY08-14]
MRRSFFITLFLYFVFFSFLYAFFDTFLEIPKSKIVSVTKLQIVHPPKPASKCQCAMMKAKVQKQIQKKSRPKKRVEEKKKPKKRVIQKKIKKKPIRKIVKKPVKKRKVQKRASLIKKCSTKKKQPTASVVKKKLLPSKIVKQESFKKKEIKICKNDTVLQADKIKKEKLVKPSYNQRYIDQYLSKIRQIILEYRYYPRIARRTRKEGLVKVSLKLFPDGSVKEMHIIQSSGHSILDRAALQTVQKASVHFPKPSQPVKLTIPLEYRLR